MPRLRTTGDGQRQADEVFERIQREALYQTMRETGMPTLLRDGVTSSRPNTTRPSVTHGTNTRPPLRNIPAGYDTGNIQAICYAIDTGAGAKDLSRFLQELGATFVEIEGVLKLYTQFFESLNKPRLAEIKEVFRLYTEESKLPARKDPCAICGNGVIYWNLIDAVIKRAEKENSEEARVCTKCFKEISKNKLECNHFGAYLVGKVKPQCPLYPTKCFPVACCNATSCLHRHMASTHKGYHERRWKASKRFLTSTQGSIITSNLMTGVEYEVVGKNNETTRTNLFKLGKSFGIDHDHSIDSFYLATELVTPPASGKKLEDMIGKTCVALQKDGFIVNAKCGLHIHIDLFKKYGHININPDFYKSLLAAYTLFEDQFYWMVPRARSNNHNIRTIRPTYNTVFDAPDYIAATKFSKIWYATNSDSKVITLRNTKRFDTPGNKYSWINFHSLLRKEGLEMRLMEGSIDSNAILWWIRFNHAFIERVAQDPKFYLKYPSYSRVQFTGLATNLTRYNTFIDFLKPDKDLLKFIVERRAMSERSSTSSSSPVSSERVGQLMDDWFPRVM